MVHSVFAAVRQLFRRFVVSRWDLVFHRLWHRYGEGSNQLVFGHRLVRRRNYYGDFLVLARGQVGEDHGRVLCANIDLSNRNHVPHVDESDQTSVIDKNDLRAIAFWF